MSHTDKKWDHQERRLSDWDSVERRDGYCPVHHIKCDDMAKMQTELTSKVPIWVFKLSITVLVLVLGAMNAYFYRMSSVALDTIEKHINTNSKALKSHMSISNTILKQMSRKNRETILNQKIIMEKLKIPHIEIPDYYGREEK